MHEPLSEEDVFIVDNQNIEVNDFESPGYILDIGGGGEGIIGLLKGEKVIAIDTRKEELEEAPDGPLKIVMDAKELQFLDNTFQTVTAFFTFMYVKRSDRKKVLQQVYRVLKPGGNVFIWDVVLLPDTDKEWFVVPLVVFVRGKEIKTGYGVKWKERVQNMEYYLDLAKEIGFNIVDNTQQDQHFFVHLKK
jgi:ubiquinone/menaquinone biosynthesis C-methylase UbiE